MDYYYNNTANCIEFTLALETGGHYLFAIMLQLAWERANCVCSAHCVKYKNEQCKGKQSWGPLLI